MTHRVPAQHDVQFQPFDSLKRTNGRDLPASITNVIHSKSNCHQRK